MFHSTLPGTSWRRLFLMPSMKTVHTYGLGYLGWTALVLSKTQKRLSRKAWHTTATEVGLPPLYYMVDNWLGRSVLLAFKKTTENAKLAIG